MSLPDTIFIFGLALVIFGPKKLPEIGRQLGKLVLEFRRASNEFKMQIEEELRAADQADRQRQLTAVEPPAAALPMAPAASALPAEPAAETLTIRPPVDGAPVSTESPSSLSRSDSESGSEPGLRSGVTPVEEEVAVLEAVAGNHPELPLNGLKHEPEQATLHHD